MTRGSRSAPVGYVPGLGRGAAGFTTRSDVGPMAAVGSADDETCAGVGSRSAELRAAKMKIRKQQQQQQGLFGTAPRGYVPGAGRGAGLNSQDEDGGPTVSNESFGGYNNDRPFVGESSQYDDEDDEADKVWAAIHERMNSARKPKRGDFAHRQEYEQNSARNKIGVQFRDLKEKLADVTEEQWVNIPDVGDYSLKHKQKQRQEAYTPIADSLLEQRKNANLDAAASVTGSAIAVTSLAADRTVEIINDMSGLGAARGKVLGMSLDSMSDSVARSVVDPKGYLTSLSSTKIATSAEVEDITKARLLLKSVRDTNPKHGPGWIASARVEEAAGKVALARKVIQEGCTVCPDNEDVWLEAARLHPPDVAKSILATAARYIPTCVKIYMKAADLEQNDSAKKAVLRKALEANPSSVTLWKAAVDLEEAEDARILLSVAVEKIPHSVDMWLALSRLETYAKAQKVLNRARKVLPAERAVWLAAAKLEESQDHNDIVDKIVEGAVKSLQKHGAVVTRAQWLQEAERAEAAGAPLTTAAVIKFTLGYGVDQEDRQRTWADDATDALSRGSVATARAILSQSLTAFPTKRSLWMQAVSMEKKHGNAESLDEVLAAACERLPRTEIFWLLRAKEQWLTRHVGQARSILTRAFAANPDSEAVWLAAAKLEWETGEVERARVLLERARERAPTGRVYMKSALLEREQKKFSQALALIDQGIAKYKTFPKLYMMAGQIFSEDLPPNLSNLGKARKYYQRGIKACPNNTVLWVLASRLEERAHTFDTAIAGKGVTKARGLLEIARLKCPKNPMLWLGAIRLERRAGNEKLARTMTARALQECPHSGLILAEDVCAAPRGEQKSKSADAIKRCPNDPRVIAAVATIFAVDRKNGKARKWFDRSVVLDPDLGDSWVRYYTFELEEGTEEQQEKVKNGCVEANPKHGELWASVTKDMRNRRKNTAECIELAAQRMLSLKHQGGRS